MTARPRNFKRRRGQGMTEYIVLVGLIGILLIAAVLRFSNQIKITFIGTSNDVNNDIVNPINTGSGSGSGDNNNNGGGPIKKPTNPDDGDNTPPATPPGGN